jgi:LacI family transcriptional regulator
LNNKPGARSELRQKILETAKSMGYSGPRTTSAGTLCLFHIARHGHTVNRDHDVFISEYIEGLSQGAKLAGYSLEIVMFNLSPMEQILETALQKSADGFIILGTELSPADVQSFSVISKPPVFIDTYQKFVNFDFVDMNNEDSMFMLLSHLYEKGHRGFGLVKGKIETRNFRLREVGFLEGLHKLGLKEDRSAFFSVDQTYHGAYNDMKKILEGHPRLPTALVCCNDIIASGCLKALAEAGIRVPEDVSIVGFDNLPLAAITDPPLTTIQVSKSQIGKMAVQLLLSRIREDPDVPSVKVLIGRTLIERNSVRQI